MNTNGDVFVRVEWFSLGQSWQPRSVLRYFRSLGLHQLDFQELEDCQSVPKVYATVILYPSKDGRNYTKTNILIQLCPDTLRPEEENSSIAQLESYCINRIEWFMPSQGVESSFPVYAQKRLPDLRNNKT
jgi:hypothetical protein